MHGEIQGRAFLVTGGAGFIGSHLVRALLAGGAARVTVLDSLGYGDVANVDASDERVRLVRFMLGTDASRALEGNVRGMDGVFHLAAEKHNQSRDRPAELLRANVEGTCQLLEVAARCAVARVVFASSLYAYGRTSDRPFVEDLPLEPGTLYGMSKVTGEWLVRHFAESHGFSFAILRFFFVYGPRQFAGKGYKSVIVRNFERILRGESPVVHGDGNQALDYVYVDDAVEATLRAMTCGWAAAVYNVATGRAVRIRDLVAAMLRVADSSLEPVFAPADATAGTSRAGSPDRIAAALGWRARVSLERGLESTYEWMRGRRS